MSTRRATILALALFGLASNHPDRRPPADGLLIASFDRADASDRSFANRPPTVSSGATFTGHVADFDGTSNAVISFPDNSEMEAAPLTIACWIRIDVYTGFRSIASKVTQASSYVGWHFYYGPGVSRGLAFGHTNSGSLPVTTNFRQAWTGSGTLSAGPWYHVAATIDALGNVPALYIDGVAQSVSSSSGGTVATLANTEPLRLGGLGGPDFTLRHDGAIDDFRYYNRVLSPAEIGGIHASGLGVTRP